MQLPNLRDDDDAVSPVIGVILMVAITVILAAVVATFVMGFGDSLTDTAPQATFSFESESDGTNGPGIADITASGTAGTLTIAHDSGDTVEASTLEIVANPGSTAVPGT